MKLIVLLIPVSLLLSCSFSGGSIPADHFYRLAAAESLPVKSIIDVKPIQADGLYNERALLFVEADRPLELQRYSYHFWAQPPAKMLQHYLQSCFSQPVFISSAEKRVQLTPRLVAFERKLVNGTAQAVISFQINQQQYQASVTTESMDMHATVVAYGQAMQEICQAVAKDF